jgi:hypothetical protein
MMKSKVERGLIWLPHPIILDKVCVLILPLDGLLMVVYVRGHANGVAEAALESGNDFQSDLNLTGN